MSVHEQEGRRRWGPSGRGAASSRGLCEAALPQDSHNSRSTTLAARDRCRKLCLRR